MTIAEVSKKYDITPDTLRYNDTIDRLNYKIKLYDEIVSGKRKDFTEEV